jgi:hypothetical protein
MPMAIARLLLEQENSAQIHAEVCGLARAQPDSSELSPALCASAVLHDKGKAGWEDRQSLQLLLGSHIRLHINQR